MRHSSTSNANKSLFILSKNAILDGNGDFPVPAMPMIPFFVQFQNISDGKLD